MTDMIHGWKVLKLVSFFFFFDLGGCFSTKGGMKKRLLYNDGCKTGALFFHFPLISAFSLVYYWIIRPPKRSPVEFLTTNSTM